MDCLADAFEDGETHLFNPVPLETIALAATAVLSDIMVRYSFRILTLYTLDLLCSYRMEGWSAFPCSFWRWGLQAPLSALSWAHGFDESTRDTHSEGTYWPAEEHSKRWPVSLSSRVSAALLTSPPGKPETRMPKHSRAWHSTDFWWYWHCYVVSRYSRRSVKGHNTNRWDALLQDWDGQQDFHFFSTLFCSYSCLHPSVSTFLYIQLLLMTNKHYAFCGPICLCELWGLLPSMCFQAWQLWYYSSLYL